VSAAASDSLKTDGLKITVVGRERDGGIKGQAGSAPRLSSAANPLIMGGNREGYNGKGRRKTKEESDCE
jgi:hypothetical protein